MCASTVPLLLQLWYLRPLLGNGYHSVKPLVLCSMRIERSMAAYLRNKGKLLCASCLDRQEASVEKVEKQS